ncbi:hypothetical protein [Clostridium aquiflavi]|uniref:Uncharacterized protein n=1 Tax=Clostridium aquiflavi TaxID=3073603 RepID=A0ABU1EJG0_9CLOT|nr:hypothetical protein [Clostridium sp. 5N-1]MDR5588536.1 hypothetical protein [Clostridium sp. 5N-1]
MQNNKARTEDIYLFDNTIAVNIYSGDFDKLLTNLKLRGQYLASKYYPQKKIVDFINDKVISGEIKKEDLNKFLPNKLSYGKHKQVFYYKFKESFNFDNSLKGVLDILSRNYRVSTLEYNELASTYYLYEKGENEDIGYIKILKENKKKILKLRVIVVKKVKYRDRNIDKFENSYFPIDIDFENNYLIIKSLVKDYIKDPNYKGENIANKLAKKFLQIFNLSNIEDKSGNQEILYNMCNKLLNEVIEKISKLGMEDIDDDINKLAIITKNKIKNKLSVEEQKLQCFDELTFQIRNIIENMIVPLCLIDNKQIEGLISYIKFRDKTAVKAVLKTRRRKETLLDSEAYLNLRQTLKKSRYIQKIRVLWNKEDISLYYDATRDECVEIHFYRKVSREDVEYAIRKFEENRS